MVLDGLRPIKIDPPGAGRGKAKPGRLPVAALLRARPLYTPPEQLRCWGKTNNIRHLVLQPSGCACVFRCGVEVSGRSPDQGGIERSEISPCCSPNLPLIRRASIRPKLYQVRAMHSRTRGVSFPQPSAEGGVCSAVVNLPHCRQCAAGWLQDPQGSARSNLQALAAL